MTRPSYASDAVRGWKSIAGFAACGLLLSLALSFVDPLRYSSTVKLLILQDVGSAVDAYTASRSEERIADNLTTLIYTSTFFDDVMSAGFSIDPHTFPDPLNPNLDNKRRRVWEKTVDATVARGSGLLTVSAYHQDVHQAEQLVRAVAFVLTKNVGQYTSGGNVQVRLIDAPLNSRWPVKPNLLANGLSGLFLGGLIGALYAVLKADRLRRKHQFVHEEF